MTPNDFGKILVEECQKIQASDFLRRYRRELKEAMLQSELEVVGLRVQLTTSRTGFGGVRLWFVCPSCGRRVGMLLKHPIEQVIGCRLCLRTDYRKHRYKGMIENTV